MLVQALSEKESHLIIIVDVLETTKFRFGQTKIERVENIQLGMSKCCGYCECSFQIKIRPYATEVTNVTKQALLRAEI